MTSIPQDIWARLTSGQTSADSLVARRALPDVTDRLLAALDSERRRHLLILIHEGEENLQDSQSRGVTVSTREMVVTGQPSARYIGLACHDPTGHAAFDLIGGDIARRLGQGNETPADAVRRTLAKWRRFWGQPPRDTLSVEEQIGLLAELWFLVEWLIPRAGASESVARWRGPFGSRHDFEWLGCSVEAKGTTSVSDYSHYISGLDQLTPPESGQLLLFSLRLRQEGGGITDLPGVVAQCRSVLASDAGAMDRFDQALVQARYSLLHEEEYATRTFRVVEQGLYAVRGHFPRLTAEQLTAGLPPGVESVKYRINLAGFEEFRVARQPSEFKM